MLIATSFKQQRTGRGWRFEKALQVVTDFEKMPPGERKALVEQLAIL